MSRAPWRARAAVFLVLFALPLGLRLHGIGHGLPRDYVPDTHVVRASLGMARDHDLVPAVGEYSTYPNLLPYLLLPVYAAYYGVGIARGTWEDAAGFGEHVLADPSGAHLLARWLVALLGAATPWVVFRAAGAAGLRRGAWVAGWLVATSLLHVQFSTQERPWGPMTLFLALALWAAGAYAERGRTRALLACAAAGGLAFATHQAGVLGLGLAGLAWLLGPGGWSGGELAARARRGALAVGVFALVALVLGHPYLVAHGVDAGDAVAASDAIAERGGVSIGGQGIIFGLRLASLTHLARAFAGYDPALVLLALAGVAPALRRRTTRAGALWVLAWAAFFLTNQGGHVRYLLPVAVLGAVPAGIAAERLLARPAARAPLALLLALPFVQALRLGTLLARTDLRVEGEAALYALPLGARPGVDRYGPEVDLSLGALERLTELREACGTGLGARERHRKRLLASGALDIADAGLDAVPLADVLAFDERAGTVAVRRGLESLGATPREVLASLGVTHVLLVRRRIDPAHPHPLMPLVLEPPLTVLDPSAGRGTREAFLPTEMDFPLTALWRVERPGPRMELFRLR